MQFQKKTLLGAILLAGTTILSGCVDDGVNGEDASQQTINLSQIATYESGVFDESAAEIVTYDPVNNRTYVVNANNKKVDVLDNSNISVPVLQTSLDLAADFATAGITGTVGDANSVDLYNGLLAVAVAADSKTDNGWVAFYKASDLTFISAVQVGALPDMVKFSHDGSVVMAAIEGEPSDDYLIDPEGQVAMIDISWDGANLNTSLTTIGFTDFNIDGTRHAELPTSKMVLDGYSATTTDNKATVAQSFEPEYIAFNSDDSKAYVSLQENNAVAVIDTATKSIDKIIGLGFKNHSIQGNEMDASQKDGVNIQNWPVMGMYMPDTIASMEYQGKSYILTANEGDDRQDWLDNVVDQTDCENAGYFFGDDGDGARCIDAFSAKDFYDADNVTLVDSEGNPFAETNGGFGEDNELRRLKFSYHTTLAMNGGTEFTSLYAYGGRSFSIYDAETGQQVFDSANDFEVMTANIYGDDFNNDNAENTGDDRSDNKGPEPEALTVGVINGQTYAFVGLERMGGIMVYNVSNPYSPDFVQYINNRDVTVDNDTLEAGGAGDLGPEGFHFVNAENSPNGKPMLVVGNEVSGTTTYYEIQVSEF
ncbi:choice-of-anchor I family protein [Thiomicrorhabdus sp. 6S2-11]|uniref:Choice-of-anchor I family protein n=1 Tax=Thiomicrorhabdus marina TaxID=2818442 RepID=A0ABS3Q574_9GAMM|nr:choice-of-anchor I family protein [Thiomicrorhabdus marina]MBO1927477.1 choice-of-anchor I family protein [Thiomicrorhabdus marina]